MNDKAIPEPTDDDILKMQEYLDNLPVPTKGRKLYDPEAGEIIEGET